MLKWSKSWETPGECRRVTPTTLEVKEESEEDESKRYTVLTGPGAPMDINTLEVVIPEARVRPGGTYNVRWAGETCLGQLKKLALADESLMGDVFGREEPVGIVFVAHENGAAEKIALRTQQLVAKELLTEEEDAQPNRREAQMSFLYAVATYGDTADAMEAFGITDADLPCAVVHYTQSDQKFKMGEEDLPLTAGSLRRFYESVRDGKRSPQENTDEEDEEL
jgi:hypothetical protein